MKNNFSLRIIFVLSALFAQTYLFGYTDDKGYEVVDTNFVESDEFDAASKLETDTLIDIETSPIADNHKKHVYNDTVWTNTVLGRRVHLQRLEGIDSLVLPRRSVAIPVAEALGIDFIVWAYDRFLQNEGWAKVDGKTIEHNLKTGWILDNDSYSGNQFSHPFHGSMFYNAARYHGHSYYASALYPLVGSMVWEYFCETNEPSYNDFLSTGIGGSAIGETTYRISDIVFDNSKRGVERAFRELIGGFLNPARGFHRLFSGQMWKTSPVRGKIVDPEPFSVDVSLGWRFLTEMRHKGRHKNLGYVKFTMDYGEHFDEKSHHKPFDFFHIHGLLNISSKDPTFSDLFIKGRIATKQFSTNSGWNYDLGLYQVYKYIDNYGLDGKSEIRQNPGDLALLSEACSFGGGLYMEKIGRHTSFSNDLLIDGIGFGCTTADHFRPRRYNYASGFSITDEVRFSINNRLSVGNEFYFARLFVMKGSENGDPTDRNKWYWGDKGNNSIFMNRAYLQVNLSSNFKFSAEHLLYYRRSNYAAYERVHAKSHELRMGLVYSL